MTFSRRFILASQSPRRLKLLEQLGLHPEVIPSTLPEVYDDSLSIEENIKSLAELKAKSVSENIEDGIIVGADTVVVLDEEVLGKPADPVGAFKILRKLSGKMHRVITAFCVYSTPEERYFTDVETTRVFFKEQSDEEIKRYISTEQPFDKAGAYGIQDKSAVFVKKIEGSYENVMGFPLTLFYKAMTDPNNVKSLNLK
ncbi:septum formation protein Maf [Candidatus Marinimicrobia bacterium MT.SAG.4]|nr:septum formation protein Maf [Candidatus Marinimicrobia bacterium MT.SAG.4]